MLAYVADEELPTDKNGAPVSSSSVYLPAPPYVPQVLDGVKLLAVFISQDLIGKFDEETDGFFISRLALAAA